MLGPRVLPRDSLRVKPEVRHEAGDMIRLRAFVYFDVIGAACGVQGADARLSCRPIVLPSCCQKA